MNDQLALVSDEEQPENDQSFTALYRAYLQGAYDAMRSRESGSELVHIAVAAMGFVLLGWIFMMIMVFR